MRLLKDYKGVALIYIVITLINVIWVINYERPSEISKTVSEKTVVFNA